MCESTGVCRVPDSLVGVRHLITLSDALPMPVLSDSRILM